MNRYVRAALAIAAAIVLPLFAQPAAADDGRRHVMTPTQKIDLVRDLPDIPAFEKDGMQYDLGYIYPIRIVNGASVAATGRPGESGFVLYHDDRYIMADGSIMSDLALVLGEDPTQGYTPPVAASGARSSASADPWGANGDVDKARGEPIPRAASAPARRGGGFTIGTLFLIFLVLFLRFRAFRDLLIGGMLAGIAAIARDKGQSGVLSGPAVPNEGFGSQAAAQRARLDALSGSPSPTPAVSAARGFGRKQA